MLFNKLDYSPKTDQSSQNQWSTYDDIQKLGAREERPRWEAEPNKHCFYNQK
jgi:hypothetical protein